jgi:GxxExxY protein
MTQIIRYKNESISKTVLFPELSYQLMSIMFEVHNQLGPGFTEEIYEKAVVYELRCRGIAYEEQKPILVTYKGQPMGNYRLDLVIDENIILELKAVSSLNDQFKQQLLSYLKATDLRLGLLINFGSVRVEHLRIVN